MEKKSKKPKSKKIEKNYEKNIEENIEEEEEEKSEKRRKTIIILIILLLLLVLIVFMITYSLFDYTKKGDTENTITSGEIRFLYTENTGVGNGVSITNAFPVEDSVGKMYSTENYVFDFKVTATAPSGKSIPYEVTARLGKNSTMPSNAVKVYLVEKNGDIEKETPLTVDEAGTVKKFSELKDTSVNVGTYEDGSAITEKTIYNGVATGTEYEQNFRYRMWISNDVDFSGITDENGNVTYPYNNKTFTTTINVYAKAD